MYNCMYHIGPKKDTFSFKHTMSNLWVVYTLHCMNTQGIFCLYLVAEFRPNPHSKIAAFFPTPCLFFPFKKSKKIWMLSLSFFPNFGIGPFPKIARNSPDTWFPVSPMVYCHYHDWFIMWMKKVQILISWLLDLHCFQKSVYFYEYTMSNLWAAYTIWTPNLHSVHVDEKVWILISWLHQKPADQDLHCFQKRR